MAIDPRQRAASYAQTVTGRSIRVSTRRRRMRKQSRVDRNIDIAPSTGACVFASAALQWTRFEG
jgi:hypothetical protein